MPPRKGAKRKSESPPIVETSAGGKKYSTRSSNRKRISYNESENEEEVNEPPPKILCSSSDDDFVVDGEENHDEEDCAKLSPVTVSEKNKKNANKPAARKQAPKKNGKALSNPSQAPINIAFKPVSYDESKIKSELNLSDESESEDSTNEDSSPRNSTSTKCQTTSKLSRVLDDNPKQWTENDATGKSEMMDIETDCVNPWMKNLEALNAPNNQQVQPQESDNDSTPQKKRKKTRQPVKKGKKSTKKSEQTEISVAEMLKLEKDQSSSSDNDDDENWEKVKPTAACDDPEQERELPKSVEVTLDISGLQRKKKGLDLQNMIRLKINRIRKEIQLDLHQVSLVGLLAHGYLINKMLGDPALLGTALSIVPSTGFPPTRTDLNYLEKLVKWISNHFKVIASKANQRFYPTKENILNCFSSGEAQSVEELVYTSVVLCRSLGILSRLVLSLQPLSAKVDSSELQQKAGNQKKTKKEKKDEIGLSEDSSTSVRAPANSKSKKTSKSSAVTQHKSPDPKVNSKINTKVKGESRSIKASSSQPKPSTKSRSVNPRENDASQPSTSKIKNSASPKKDTNQLQPKRSRRKSAEKPVKYEESPLDDTEEESVSKRRSLSASKKKTSPKEKATKNTTKKDIKKPSPKVKPKQSQVISSSDEFEESMSDDSEHENNKSSASKKDSSAHQKSRKIISTDSDDAADNETSTKKKKTTDAWFEVYLEQEEQWMSVDISSGKIHCDRHLERNSSDPLLYVVAFNPDLTWKDVTARYASSFLSTTRKQRSHPTWTKLLNIHREKPSPRSKAEDESLEKSLTERPMPTSISEFKSHPLYALQRHLLKFEAIYPPTAIPVGFIRKEPVYARECVKNLHSRETWLKEAKVVRIGEKPYKIVKARPKWDRNMQKMVTDQPLELFGDWQIEDYIPPPAVDGIVPRNAYGNVELFLPRMLPKGTKHLQIPGLNKVARRIGIDCAPAMTGWDYHGGWSHPVYDGFVVCEEHVETLMDAWQAANEEQEQREREKREKRVYDNWRRIIRGLLIRERLQAKYFRNLTEEEIPPANDDKSGPSKLPSNKTVKGPSAPSKQQRNKK